MNKSEASQFLQTASRKSYRVKRANSGVEEWTVQDVLTDFEHKILIAQTV